MDSGMIIRPGENNPVTDLANGDLAESAVPRTYYPTGDYAAHEETALLVFWRIVRKHQGTVLATLAIVFALAVVGTMHMTRLYEATSRIAIYPENTNALGLKDLENSVNTDWDYNITLETQISILRSDALALKVIEALQLQNNAAFTGEARASAGTPLAPLELSTKERARLLGTLRSGLSVQVIPRTRVVEVRYLHPDPKLAAEAVNALINTYIEENFKTKYETTMQTSDWLSKQLSDLKLKVETSQEKLVRYQKEHGIVGIDEKQNVVTSKLDELNRQLTAAQAERIQKQAVFNLAKAGDPSFFSRVDTAQLLQKLQSQRADLQLQHAQLKTQMGDSHPKILELNNQLREINSALQDEQKSILARVESDYLAAAHREKMLESEFEKQKQAANKLNESAIEFAALKREAESNRQLYEGLLQKLKEAGVSAGLRSSNVRIVDVASVPTEPARPNVPRNLVLGFLLGLFGGVGLAFLTEALDTSVRTPDQVGVVSALPALGIIPLFCNQEKETGVRKLLPSPAQTAKPNNSEPVETITHIRPKSQLAESYRALRTSILLSSSGAPPKLILVTSALPQEGKTTTSVNSAIVLAQRGGRVLLIDADLRRPSLDKLLGISNAKGLSTLLAGATKPEKVVVRFPDVPNLWVLPAGPVPPQPAELLSSASMRNCLAKWRQEYDHVIIDTPPCLSVTDAVLLSVEVDRVILVIRSGKTAKAALRRARDLLFQVNANIMGVVLNAVNLSSSDQYYYYHHYYYNYSGKYYE